MPGRYPRTGRSIARPVHRRIFPRGGTGTCPPYEPADLEKPAVRIRRPGRRPRDARRTARAPDDPARAGSGQESWTTARARESTRESPDRAVSPTSTRLSSSFSSTTPLTVMVAPSSSSGTTTMEEKRTP